MTENEKDRLELIRRYACTGEIFLLLRLLDEEILNSKALSDTLTDTWEAIELAKRDAP